MGEFGSSLPVETLRGHQHHSLQMGTPSPEILPRRHKGTKASIIFFVSWCLRGLNSKWENLGQVKHGTKIEAV